MTVTIARDLRGKFGEARNQGFRPTCLAFATSDLHAVSRPAAFIALSVEYLHFHAVQRSIPPNPKKAVTVTAIHDALSMEGQPVETDWRYLPALPTNISKWQPPKGLTVFRQTLSSRTGSVGAITSALNKNEVVLLILRISEAFYTPDSLGVVAYVKHDRHTGNHAVVAVAHGALGKDQVILVRNSWGRDWGLSGHAWLYSGYLTERLYSVLTIP